MTLFRQIARVPKRDSAEKCYESDCATLAEARYTRCAGVLGASRRRDPQDEQRQALRRWRIVRASQQTDQKPKVKTDAARCVV